MEDSVTEPLNWSGELEAVHEVTGEVRRVAAVGDRYGARGQFHDISPELPGKDDEVHWSFNADGTHKVAKWRIRNRKPASDSLEARKDALIRHAAVNASGYTQELAQALLAEMDPDIAEAERVGTKLYGCNDPEWQGDLARTQRFKLLKRGRELQQQEQGK